MKPAEKRDWAIFIVCLTNLLLLLTLLLLSGCGQEQEAPQPIIVNVTVPETPAMEVAEPAVVAEPAEEPPAVEDAPAVAEPAEDPAEDPEVIGLLAIGQARMSEAVTAWEQGQQQRGNHFYLDALEALFLLERDHGWEDKETTAALNDMLDTALEPYADDLDALGRIFDGLKAFGEWLKEN